MTIPFYLQEKLKYLGIESVNDNLKDKYCQIFACLRDKYPNTTYKVLYDLYCVSHNLSLNSLSIIQKNLIKQDYKQRMPYYITLGARAIAYGLDMALIQANLALFKDEIPIGAVIIKDGKVIGNGHNSRLTNNDITHHAEIMAISEARKSLDSMYLEGCDLYVTIEPCLMCSGAILASRLKRVIFGAIEPKTGAVISQYRVFANKAVNHHTQVIGPINNEKCAALIKQYLQSKR